MLQVKCCCFFYNLRPDHRDFVRAAVVSVEFHVFWLVELFAVVAVDVGVFAHVYDSVQLLQRLKTHHLIHLMTAANDRPKQKEEEKKKNKVKT